MAKLSDITIKPETRLCIVDGKVGYFHCWEQYAYVVAPGLTVGSYPGGQVAYINGIVEFEDGVKRVDCANIKFIDEEHDYLRALTDIGIGGKIMTFKKYNKEFKCKRISKIHFDDIHISKAFEQHPPKQDKLIIKAIKFGNHRKLNPIIVDENYILVDGYCTYLIAKGYKYRGILLKIYMAKGLNANRRG